MAIDPPRQVCDGRRAVQQSVPASRPLASLFLLLWPPWNTSFFAPLPHLSSALQSAHSVLPPLQKMALRPREEGVFLRAI